MSPSTAQRQRAAAGLEARTRPPSSSCDRLSAAAQPLSFWAPLARFSPELATRPMPPRKAAQLRLSQRCQARPVQLSTLKPERRNGLSAMIAPLARPALASKHSQSSSPRKAQRQRAAAGLEARIRPPSSSCGRLRGAAAAALMHRSSGSCRSLLVVHAFSQCSTALTVEALPCASGPA
jgi:hypothetical protein